MMLPFHDPKTCAGCKAQHRADLLGTFLAIAGLAVLLWLVLPWVPG